MESNLEIKLTQFSRASGCGCKIAPGKLAEILKGTIDNSKFKNLLVGIDSNDDAAIYKINDDLALISTTDFFTPIVNDPFHFGMVAAANALSDIYAMGGKPVMAVSILGWPIDKLPIEACKLVIEGAQKICSEAGIPLAGGHSIDTLEPIFGLAVTGTINPNKIKKNNALKLGDLIFLTKPLGTGILSAALKREKLENADYDILLKTLVSLNKIGEELGNQNWVNAITDVTGFGLIGHLCEMTEESSFSIELNYNRIPKFDCLDKYLPQFIYPDNTTKNLNAYKDKVDHLNGLEFLTLCDPQTSGGLLISIDPKFEKELVELFSKYGIEQKCCVSIGSVIETANKKIVVQY